MNPKKEFFSKLQSKCKKVKESWPEMSRFDNDVNDDQDEVFVCTVGEIREPSIEEINKAIEELHLKQIILVSVLENRGSCTDLVFDAAYFGWESANERVVELIESVRNAKIWNSK